MRKDKIILAILIAAYTIYFSWVTISRHRAGLSGRFDLGNMEQTIWNTSEGRIFQMTNPDTSEISSRLAFHADFLLVLIAPIYKLFPHAETLLIIQALGVALGAIPVYLIVKNILPQRKLLPLFFSIFYLLSPILERANLYDFHSETLGVTFLLFTFYFLLVEKTKPFLLFFFLALISKETISLTLTMVCFWGIVKNKKRALCLFLLVGCIVYFLFMVRMAIPAANGVTERHFALRHFTEGNEKFFDIVAGYIKSPLSFLINLFDGNAWQYYWNVLSYGGFLFLLSPLAFLFSAPTLLVNVLARGEQFTSLNYQYSAMVAPGLIISTIYGFNYLGKKLKNNRLLPSFLICVISLINLRTDSPLPLIGKTPYLDFLTYKSPAITKIEKWGAKIPSYKSISVTNNAGSHFAKRENLYVFPNKIDEADYVIVAAKSWQEWATDGERDKIIAGLKRNPKYKLLDEGDEFWLFKKNE